MKATELVDALYREKIASSVFDQSIDDMLKEASIDRAKQILESIKKRNVDFKNFQEVWAKLSKEEKQSIIAGSKLTVKRTPKKDSR